MLKNETRHLHNIVYNKGLNFELKNFILRSFDLYLLTRNIQLIYNRIDYKKENI